MKQKIAGGLAATVLLCATLPAVTAADAPGRMVFKGSAPDANGVFTVELSIYDVTFNAFQAVLYYDASTVIPVDDSNQPTTQFWEFAEKEDDGWMGTVATSIDAEKGLIDFSGYVNPGSTVATDGPEQTGVAVVGESGLPLLTFRFRKVGTEPVKLAVASQDSGLPYQPYLPAGCAAVNAGIGAPLTVSFQYDQKVGQDEEVDVPSYVPQQPTGATADQLLEHATLLKIDSHAAVVAGEVTAIYSGEPEITAYIKDTRTYVPIRFVAERMGAKVDWIQETQTVVVQKGNHTVTMTIGSKNYTVDGVTYTGNAAPEFRKSGNHYSRTMVPVRFVSEALGYQVEWDNDRRMVVIGDQTVQWDMSSEAADQALVEAVRLLDVYGGFV